MMMMMMMIRVDVHISLKYVCVVLISDIYLLLILHSKKKISSGKMI